jgi:hypothetical protein
MGPGRSHSTFQIFGSYLPADFRVRIVSGKVPLAGGTLAAHSIAGLVQGNNHLLVLVFQPV